MSYRQCFICRVWSWDVCSSNLNVELCLPCYVDILEVRQARGVMGEAKNTLPDSNGDDRGARAQPEPGNSPSPFDLFPQIDLFDS